MSVIEKTILFVFAVFLGWVFNIVQIVNFLTDGHEVTSMFVFKCIGVVFVPLGIVLGWVGIF